MSDEVTEVVETPEATPEAEKPAINDEQVAEYLGIPAEDLKSVKDIGGLYKKANQRNQQVAEMQKQLERQMQAAPQQTLQQAAEDDTPELDAATVKALDKWFTSQYGSVLFAEQARHQREIQDTLTEFHEDHIGKEGYSPAAVDEAMEELGLWSIVNRPDATPKQIKSALTKAYNYVKVNSTDIDALVEAKLAERLKESKDKGEEVVSIKPKKPAPKEDEKSLDDPNLTPDQRASLVKRLLNQQ